MASGQKVLQPPTLAAKFVSAGLAACSADIVTFPLDTAKVRLQLQTAGSSAPKPGGGPKRGPMTTRALSATRVARQQLKYRGLVGTIRTMCREEGARSLYNGLGPGLQRQMVFASIRIGLYEDVKQFYVRLFQAEGLVSNTNVGLRIIAGITTGAIAISCAQPTDVVKVRLQAQSKGGAKRYNGAMDAYRQIARKEGIRGLWKGLLPNAARNAIVNAAELVTYDMLKETILRRKLLPDNVACHFVSAFGAGFLATVVASPVDVVKTRFMNASKGIYRGAMHCAVLMYKEDGLKGFYKGFIPGFMRLGSWNIVMFMCFEQLKKVFMQRASDSASSSSPPASRSPLAVTPPTHHRAPPAFAPAPSPAGGEVLLRQPAMAWARVAKRTDSDLP